MSYWNQNTALSTAVDDLLGKEDVTLQEILEEAEVIQECKSQNKKLIEFLTRSDILREVIVLTTRVPAEENGETVRYKYASIACELLTSELPQIIETIANDAVLLDELYAFLESPAPLNPLLASFFSRIMGVLVTKTSEQNWFSYQVSCLRVLEYLKSKGNFIELLLRHLGTSAIMDLILKMYAKIEGNEIRDNFLSWLDEENFLEQLICMLTPDAHPDIQSNVCQLLGDFIVSSRDSGVVKSSDSSESDRIIRKIESEEYIKKVLDQMLLEPRCERNIVGGIAVVLTILGVYRREEYSCSSWDGTPNESSNARENSLSALRPALPHMLDLLQNPPKKACVRTTVGVLDPPLGATRVEVVRLISALVEHGDEQLLEEMQRLNLLNVLLDLFFLYPWNNFLHAQVEATLAAALSHLSLAKHIFVNCRITQRIVQAWKDNDAQEKEKKPRRGYMGHLIRISNTLVKECDTAPLETLLFEVLNEDEMRQWSGFVETSLAKVNGDQSSGVAFQNKRHNSSDSEQYYAELYRRYYQLQGLGPSFADNFCDEQQLDLSDDAMDASDARALKPGFPDADPDDVLAKQTELFHQLCAQRLQSLDHDSDMWSSMIPNPSETKSTRAWKEEGSSDEENDAEFEDEWTESTAVAPLEQSNPWSADVLSASSPPDPGWANFESSPFIANFDYNLSSTIATSAPGDSDTVPFDLTPTEVPAFPANDEDWVAGTPPSDWLTAPPSETRAKDVEKSASEPSEPPTSTAVPADDNPISSPVEASASPAGDAPKPPMDLAGNPENEEMEIAQVVESESSAVIVVASEMACDSVDGKAGEPVIVHSTENKEVAAQLAQLLAEVCNTSELRQPGPPHADSPTINSTYEVSVKDDADDENIAALVPKTTSKTAVNEDGENLNPPPGITPNDVTAI